MQNVPVASPMVQFHNEVPTTSAPGYANRFCRSPGTRSPRHTGQCIAGTREKNLLYTYRLAKFFLLYAPANLFVPLCCQKSSLAMVRSLRRLRMQALECAVCNGGNSSSSAFGTLINCINIVEECGNIQPACAAAKGESEDLQTTLHNGKGCDHVTHTSLSYGVRNSKL